MSRSNTFASASLSIGVGDLLGEEAWHLEPGELGGQRKGLVRVHAHDAADRWNRGLDLGQLAAEAKLPRGLRTPC